MSNCQSKYDRSYHYKNIFLDIIDNSLKNSLKNSKLVKYPISFLKYKLIYPETVCKYINTKSNSYDYFIKRIMYIRKKICLKNYNLRYNRYLNRSDNLRLRLKNTINIILQRKKFTK